MRYAGEAFDPDTDAAAPGNPEAAMGASMELARLRASLSKLPPLCRDFLSALNRVEGLTHAEIAGRLGVSVRTIDR